MRDITVEKHELVAKVKENREAHRAIFLEAVEGYRAEAVRQLEAHIERIKDGHLPEVRVVLPAPSDHTADYDRVLAMLDWETAATIKIAEEDFAAYVMDDWHWKRQFLTTNSAYSAGATGALGAMGPA
jgi:hypothetical protein